MVVNIIRHFVPFKYIRSCRCLWIWWCGNVSLWISGSRILLTLTSHDAMGVRIVQRSAALGTPVIFVSMNYRWGLRIRRIPWYSSHWYSIYHDRVSGAKQFNICVMSHSHHIYSTAFGFLGGQEVFEQQVGNLGLWDRKRSALVWLGRFYDTSAERVALRWVKRHIASFGGNSSQIMM
jgi:hypothetical protein